MPDKLVWRHTTFGDKGHKIIKLVTSKSVSVLFCFQWDNLFSYSLWYEWYLLRIQWNILHKEGVYLFIYLFINDMYRDLKTEGNNVNMYGFSR